MSAAPDTVPESPPPRRRHRWIWRVLLALLVLVLLVVGGVTWLLTTEQGARVALEQARRAAGPGVEFEGVEGRIGGDLRIGTVEVSRPGLYARIEGLEMKASPLEPLRGLLHVESLKARSVTVLTADTGEAAKIPATFEPPYPVKLDGASIGELRLGELPAAAAQVEDPERRREILRATREDDIVLRDIFVRGSGDGDAWHIEEARAQTPYGKVQLSGRVGSDAPFAVDLQASAEGTAAERPYAAQLTAKGTLKQLQVNAEGRISGDQLTARAVLEPFASAPVRLFELHAPSLDLSKHASAPKTNLSVDAKLDAAEGGAFAGPVRIENANPGPWNRQQLPFTSARARVVVRPERVDVRDLSLGLPGGGSASGRLVLQKSGIEAELRVADVNLAALHTELQPTSMSGTVSASGDRQAQKFQVALEDPRFAIEGAARLAGERLEVETATVRTGGGSVTAQGGMALAGAKEFRFEGRARHFDPSAFVKAAKGDLNFSFVATGSLAEPVSGEIRADIAPSTYMGLPASGNVLLAGSAERLARADVAVGLGEARLTAKGSYGGRGDALEVGLRAPNLSTLAKPFGLALAGSLDAQARLTGTFRSPAGQVTAKGANLALPNHVYVKDLALRARAGVEPDSPIEATVDARGVALGEERPPKPFAESVRASLKGTRREHRLEAAAQITKESRLAVVLEGGLDPRAKAPAWDGRVQSLAMTGPGAFELTQPTSLYASAQRVELGDARLKGEWGEARMAMARWTPRSLEFRGSTDGIQVQNLARSLRMRDVPRSNLVIAGKWDIRATDTFNGTLDLHRVSGDLRVGEPRLALGLRELALRFEAVRGRTHATFKAEGERVGRVTGEGTGMIVRGETGWTFAASAPVQARVVAEHTNLEALSPWLGNDARLGGRLNANITVTGTGENPKVSGEATAQDLVVREPTTGFEMEQGQLAVALAGRSVSIRRFSAVTPWNPPRGAREAIQMNMPERGTITAEGSIDLDRRTGALVVRAQDAVITQLPSRFLAASGQARVEANADGMLISGNFKADAGWVGALDTPLPSVSEDVIVVRASQPKVEKDPEPVDQIRVDLRLALGEHVYFQGRGLDTRLTGELHITGRAPAGLRAVGAIRTVDGTYKGYGQKLTIERGVLQFAGPLDNPRLNVLALRKGLPVEAGVEVLGTATRPRVRLVSQPEVPEPEKLSWLVLGRGPSDLAPGDASVLLAAATSMLGKDGPGNIGQRFGVDEVKIGRADTQSILGVLPQSTVAGKTGSASAAEVVSVGKKITRDIHLTYEQGLADAEGAVKIAWQISRHFQLIARAGYLPGLDAVYRWTFN